MDTPGPGQDSLDWLMRVHPTLQIMCLHFPLGLSVSACCTSFPSNKMTL
jgi:hypothetical protein